MLVARLERTRAQQQKPLNERVRTAKFERGDPSLDIQKLAETGASVPVVLFVDPARLSERTLARVGIIALQKSAPCGA